MRSLDEQVGNTFNNQRLVARLTTVYGLLAIVLACIGLYGVAAYMVARRTREIGIRMALGAARGTVLAMVLRGAMSPIAFGIAIGIPAVLAGGRAISSQLYGVKGYDPLILASATVVLAVAALIAALVPARRATKVDPIVALRYE
jgi:ABC-type antimicrobial peptide transport system permease subunit